MSKNTKVRNQVALMAWPVFSLMALAAHRVKEQSSSLASLATCNLEWELDSGQGRVIPDADCRNLGWGLTQAI